MYIPPYASVTDPSLMKAFIREHSFGTLISSTDPLSANHYPFLVTEEGEKTFLWTHLAKSNPQWKDLHGNKCLVIFTGPHTYVSPSYYVDPLNVPTWSYTAVHARCVGEVIQDQELEKTLMQKLVSHYEEKNQTNWSYDLPEDFHNKLLKAIVWVRLEVQSLEGKFKLSQNRDRDDYESVLEAFTKRGTANDKEILRYMGLTSPYSK